MSGLFDNIVLSLSPSLAEFALLFAQQDFKHHTHTYNWQCYLTEPDFLVQSPLKDSFFTQLGNILRTKLQFPEHPVTGCGELVFHHSKAITQRSGHVRHLKIMRWCPIYMQATPGTVWVITRNAWSSWSPDLKQKRWRTVLLVET